MKEEMSNTLNSKEFYIFKAKKVRMDNQLLRFSLLGVYILLCRNQLYTKTKNVCVVFFLIYIPHSLLLQIRH